ncbi:MAG: hypothetical protein ACOYMA_20470 [Bacteroidia bacterium]
MNKNQSEILVTIKITLYELVQMPKSFNINYPLFENKYFNLKKQLALYIEKEDNEILKKKYQNEYRNIVEYEVKGIEKVSQEYKKSTKINASDKANSVFESSLMVAVKHIANDFDTFFNCIPESSTIINNKV